MWNNQLAAEQGSLTMSFIRCPRCRDIIPLLVVACPSCRRCPSCGRKKCIDQKRCKCDYPESEIAIASLTEYYGVPASLVEVERQCLRIERRYVLVGILLLGALVCLSPPVAVLLCFMFRDAGFLASLFLPFVVGIPVFGVLEYRRSKLIRRVRSQASNTILGAEKQLTNRST